MSLKSTLWTIFACICLAPTCISSAASGSRTLSSYTVHSKGFRIGTITSSQQFSVEDKTPTIHFETDSHVKASFLWLGYRLESVEKGVLKNGTLVSYSRHGQENGENIDVEGNLEGTSFRFKIKDRGTVSSVVIPRQSYDSTTMECPEAQLDFRSRNPVSIRVLDVEHMSVVKREYRFIRESRYTVAGKDYPCQIIDFVDQNKSARRWINKVSDAVIMYRQDGTGTKSYSMQASSVIRD